jgi:hypothetical protein
MKKSALKLAAVLGAGVGAKELFGMGVSAKQAEADLRRLSGADFNDMRKGLASLRGELDSIKEGAGDIIRTKTFDVIASRFIGQFGKSKDEIETFNAILEASAKQAIITGTSIEEMYESIVAARTGGGFAGLIGVGGFDVVQKKITEDIIAAKDPGELGGRIGLDLRTKALIEIISKASDKQTDQLENLDSSLILIRDLQTDVKEATEKTGSFLIESVAKTVRALSGDIKFSEKTTEQNIKKSNEELKSTFFGLFKVRPRSDDEFIDKRSGLIDRSGKPKPVVKEQNIEVSMPTTIIIKNAMNDDDVKRIVREEDSKRINEAKRQIIKSEETP